MTGALKPALDRVPRLLVLARAAPGPDGTPLQFSGSTHTGASGLGSLFLRRKVASTPAAPNTAALLRTRRRSVEDRLVPSIAVFVIVMFSSLVC